MALGQGLKHYRCSNLTPRGLKSVVIKLKNHDASMTLDIPGYDVAETPQSETSSHANRSLSRVVLAHAAFMASMQPDLDPDEDFYKTCTAEANVVSLFFPNVKAEAIRICFTAWLAFVCYMDDILETLPLLDREETLVECIEIMLQGQTGSTTSASSFQSVNVKTPVHPYSPPGSPETKATIIPKDTRIQEATEALYSHCTRLLSPSSSRAFFKAASVVFNAHIDETNFAQGRLPNDLATYMSIRSRTIALDPFFEVLKCEYLPPGCIVDLDWTRLQAEVCRAVGLQNDLIGLDRDLQNGEQLNAVVVMLRAFGDEVNSNISTSLLAPCVGLVSAQHNQSVARSLERYNSIVAQAAAPSEAESLDFTDPSTMDAVREVADHIFLMCETHLKWCTAAKRYNTTSAAPQEMISTAPEPASAASQLEVTLDNDTQLVRSSGIFHGLPTYPPSIKGLTAIVTGATGVSGYSMVKALASAPERWSKIYCLSSRPPPANFFADLGPGAADEEERIQHLQVDFLADPAEIALRLSQIEHVDHIFYFSYMQPPPKADSVLDLWANADELSSINASLLTNFLAALQHPTVGNHLRPKRFMLQTGTKHYAFYLGPAPLPAFESDPRVALSRNFYYEQEDALALYCKSVNAAWSVCRPSYIIGAVRDGTLNHLLGFGVYASVQAHLGQTLAFPGDYRAWDREQVQSTGLLNAFFEEWLVLSPSSSVQNQAFNIHDGVNFTWGRVWPMLAKWFGVDWSPPSDKPESYREVTLPYPLTPRGYGPQAQLRSTFSLLEWSLQPAVEQAWEEMRVRDGLVLDPFDDRYRARVFSFADSAVIGDAAMTTSVSKARRAGFLGTVDSYRSVFETLRDMGRLRLIPGMVVDEFREG